MMKKQQVSDIILRFFRWFCHPDYVEDIEGDLIEKYERCTNESSKRKANWMLLKAVFSLFRPSLIRPIKIHHALINSVMFKHNIKISFRTLLRDKGYSFINISGLALGLTVIILVGLWINDEFNFYRYHDNYEEIARVMQHRKIGDGKETWFATPIPLAEELRNNFREDFEQVITTSFFRDLVFSHQNQIFQAEGYYMEPEGPDLFSFKMLSGELGALNDPTAIFLSASFAKSIFGNKEPLGETLEISNDYRVKVVGIYKDFPTATTFSEADFVAAWDMNMAINPRIKAIDNLWNYTSFQTFARLKKGSDFSQVSEKIKQVISKNNGDDLLTEEASSNTFLHPMSKWHLYARFENGVNTGGAIETVWLLGVIGLFVLLLATINFVNLSTARSEKRSKEVGLRKAIGSHRIQLIGQFYTESFLVVGLAFILSLALVVFCLPSFNEIADKQIQLPWSDPIFWMISALIIIVVGLFSGSYPAFYLSSFNPIKALKGNARMGKAAILPRKFLVTMQFTISTMLIVGTLTVYQQIQYAQNRSIGYDQNNLVTIFPSAGKVRENFDLIRYELIQQGVVEEIAQTAAPLTSIWAQYGNINWEGKDPKQEVNLPNTGISYEFGKTVGWQFVDGRDFSSEYALDTAAFVINEAAVQLMQLEDPVGKKVNWGKNVFQVIGVIKDMVIESPYQPIRPHFYHINKKSAELLVARLSPVLSANEATNKIEAIIKSQDPAALINSRFVDETFARKFSAETRIGKLSTVFAMLAILISCLGLLGLISYVAERRKKEIGIRKVLGASTLQLWKMLSKDFVLLVLIGCLIAIPITQHFLNNWLENFDYRTELSFNVFAIAGVGSLLITLLTVSFQALKAAWMNPVSAIKSE